MTDAQLYIALGVPSLMALLSIGVNIALYLHLSSTMNTRFDGVDRKFDAVDRKFESIERRLEMIQGDTHQMDIRITKLEK